MYLTIPLNKDNLTYKYTLSLENKYYIFQIKYNGRMGRWTLDIQDYRGVPIVSGIVLSMGAELIGRFAHSDLPPGDLFMYSVRDLYEECGIDGPGNSHFLIYKE